MNSLVHGSNTASGAIPPILPQSMKDTLNGHAMPLEQLKRSTGGQHKSINATTPVSTTFQRRSPLPTLEAHVPVEGTVGSAGYVPPPRSTPGQAPARQVPLPQSFTSASGKRAANAKRGKTVGATRERREEAGIGRPQFLPWDDSEDAALLSYIHANILENATATLEPPRKLPRRDAYGRMIDWTVIERAMHAQEVLGGKKRSAAAYATRGKILLAGEELKLEQESVGTSKSATFINNSGPRTSGRPRRAPVPSDEMVSIRLSQEIEQEENGEMAKYEMPDLTGLSRDDAMLIDHPTTPVPSALPLDSTKRLPPIRHSSPLYVELESESDEEDLGAVSEFDAGSDLDHIPDEEFDEEDLVPVLRPLPHAILPPISLLPVRHSPPAYVPTASVSYTQFSNGHNAAQALAAVLLGYDSLGRAKRGRVPMSNEERRKRDNERRRVKRLKVKAEKADEQFAGVDPALNKIGPLTTRSRSRSQSQSIPSSMSAGDFDPAMGDPVDETDADEAFKRPHEEEVVKEVSQEGDDQYRESTPSAQRPLTGNPNGSFWTEEEDAAIMELKTMHLPAGIEMPWSEIFTRLNSRRSGVAIQSRWTKALKPRFEKAQKALAAARRPKNPSTTIKLKNNGPTYTIATRRSQSPSALRVKQRVADIMAQTAEEEEAEADRNLRVGSPMRPPRQIVGPFSPATSIQPVFDYAASNLNYAMNYEYEESPSEDSFALPTYSSPRSRSASGSSSFVTSPVAVQSHHHYSDHSLPHQQHMANYQQPPVHYEQPVARNDNRSAFLLEQQAIIAHNTEVRARNAARERRRTQRVLRDQFGNVVGSTRMDEIPSRHDYRSFTRYTIGCPHSFQRKSEPLDTRTSRTSLLSPSRHAESRPSQSEVSRRDEREGRNGRKRNRHERDGEMGEVDQSSR